MNLLNSDSELRLFLPNVVNTVEGETPLFDKILPVLDDVQRALADEFVSDNFMRLACDCDPAASRLREFLRPLLAIRAFAEAIPLLDIILTPNGFGVVQNSNVAPASEARVRALKDSLYLRADSLVQRCVDELRRFRLWRASPQGRRWASVLQPDLRMVSRVDPAHVGPLYNRYLDMRDRISSIEAKIADISISHEELRRLRDLNLAKCLSPVQQDVVTRFNDIVTRAAQGQSPDACAIGMTVNIIRHQKEEFPLWPDSNTARLYRPPVFRNDPACGGYFF